MISKILKLFSKKKRGEKRKRKKKRKFLKEVKK
jgi:hypothetical protein